MFHDVKPACQQHRKQQGQGFKGYKMFCVSYEINTRELRSLVYIPFTTQNNKTKH